MQQTEFNHVAKQLRPRLLERARHYLGNKEEAEDAVQEVMLKLWFRRLTIANAQMMLHLAGVVVKNTCLNYLRKSGTEMVLNEEETAAVPSPHALMEEREDAAQVEAVVRALPDKYRAVMILRNEDNMSYGDIAEIMGCSEGAVRVTLSRARRLLMEKLKKSDYI